MDGMVDAALAFVDSLVPRADGGNPFPYWHGWALREAFLAGVAAERERCAAVAHNYVDDPHVSTTFDRGHLDLICEAIACRIREGKP